MNLRTGSAIHWTTRFWEVCWEKLFTCPENHYILITNIARCSLEIVGKFWIYVIVYFITYIRAKSCAVRREWLIDERSNIWFSFSFSSQILTLSRNLSKRNSLTTPPFDSTNHMTNRFWEKREERDRGKFIVLPCFESVNETHVSPKFSSLGERKKERRGAREDNNKEGEGRVNRGWSIYCTTVGQRIDFTPRRFAPFFPSTTPLVSQKKKEREKGNLSEKEIEKFVRDSKEERSPFPLNFN